MVLKNPFFFGFAIIICVFFQIWTAYVSVRAFLEEDFLQAFVFFLGVPLLGLVIGLYYAWFRRQKMPKA